MCCPCEQARPVKTVKVPIVIAKLRRDQTVGSCRAANNSYGVQGSLSTVDPCEDPLCEWCMRDKCQDRSKDLIGEVEPWRVEKAVMKWQQQGEE